MDKRTNIVSKSLNGLKENFILCFSIFSLFISEYLIIDKVFLNIPSELYKYLIYGAYGGIGLTLLSIVSTIVQFINCKDKNIELKRRMTNFAIQNITCINLLFYIKHMIIKY